MWHMPLRQRADDHPGHGAPEAAAAAADGVQAHSGGSNNPLGTQGAERTPCEEAAGATADEAAHARLGGQEDEIGDAAEEG